MKKPSNKKTCSCYSTRSEKRHLYDEFTGNIKGFYIEEVGICLGTRECDICKCKGNRSYCDFY